MSRPPLVPVLLSALIAFSAADLQPTAQPQAGSIFPVGQEARPELEPWLAASRYEAQPSEAEKPRARLRLERVTTAVGWPRGLALVDGELVVLARGRHRRSGGIDPKIEDHAGTLYTVDPNVNEPVREGETAGERVQNNGRVLTRPDGAPFLLYDPAAGTPDEQTSIDRPYCTLRFDQASSNFFICGYSGVDLPGGKFRKNATDSIHRFDLRTKRWYPVELHDAAVVPAGELSYTVSNAYYPHHDPAQNPAPHGWVNGGDNAAVAGEFLYVAAKDNHLLVQYDLGDIRRDPEAGPPESRPVLGPRVDLALPGSDQTRSADLFGHSALAVHGGWLYIGYRTSSVVIRYPLDERGDLVVKDGGELVAVFEAWDSALGHSANLMDIAFDSAGQLFVSCATRGRIWNVGIPDPEHVFDGRWSSPAVPYVDLREMTGKADARTGNILFDQQDRLLVCSGNYDSDSRMAGVVYRVVEVD